MMEDGEIILNVTIKAEAQIAQPFLQWLQTEHIPETMQTGCFTEYRLVKLLEVDEAEGPTYAVQYTAACMADYQRYLKDHAVRLRQRSFVKWGEQFVAFRTLMQAVKPTRKP